MSRLPDVPGVLRPEEIEETAASIADLQLPDGMIPWFPDGHCDPWNHVETAMALDVAGFHLEAERAYEWLAESQRPDGAWHNYYWPDGSVEEDKLDTNVCAYVATGVWHHWRSTWERAFLDNLWPTVEQALDFVLAQRRPVGPPSPLVELAEALGEGSRQQERGEDLHAREGDPQLLEEHVEAVAQLLPVRDVVELPGVLLGLGRNVVGVGHRDDGFPAGGRPIPEDVSARSAG